MNKTAIGGWHPDERCLCCPDSDSMSQAGYVYGNILSYNIM